MMIKPKDIHDEKPENTGITGSYRDDVMSMATLLEKEKQQDENETEERASEGNIVRQKFPALDSTSTFILRKAT